MGLLALLTFIVFVTSVAITNGRKSRAESIVTGSLVFNAIVVLPIYALGLVGKLTRTSLAMTVLVICLALLALVARREGAAGFRCLPKRVAVLALLPLEGIRQTWRKRSYLAIGAILAAGMFPYMLLVAYLAPSFRDWDGLWYHEALVGFTIQNHGFAPVALPTGLQVINGTQRLCEMTDVWFAIFGGRRVVDMSNTFFLPLFAASMFVLVRRYSKDVVSGVAWASAMILLPATLRLVQSTLVDPQSASLLLATAYFVTHPVLDRRNAMWSVLALTLAVGAKIWNIVPCGLLALFLLVRLLRHGRANGWLPTLGIITTGLAGFLGMQATTYLRNFQNFHNPFWPMLGYENPKYGIHWPAAEKYALDLTKARGGVDLNDPFPVLVKKMLAAPYTVMGPGPSWQVSDYGFAWAWVVLPVLAVVTSLLFVRWISARFAILFRLRTRGPDDEAMGSAMMLALVASVSLYLSPAVFIARYHVASLGMLVACLAWTCSRWRTQRLSEDLALFAQLGSFMMAFWGPQSTRWVYLFDAHQIWHWVTTQYPQRELEDVKSSEGAHLLVSPVNLISGTAREKEVRRGDVVAFDNLEYVTNLWNNEYSNRVEWIDSPSDPLGEAEKKNAKWIYTKSGTVLNQQLAKSTARWEVVGPLEIESFGNVYRRRGP